MKPCMLERKMVHTQKQNSGLYRLFYRLARHRRILHFMMTFIIEMKLAGLLFDPK
jgi:hypothetical protein